MAIDNFCSGFVGVALIVYMSQLTHAGYTATQYALLSSFYALPGKLLKGFSGVAVEHARAGPHAAGGVCAVLPRHGVDRHSRRCCCACWLAMRTPMPKPAMARLSAPIVGDERRHDSARFDAVCRSSVKEDA